VSNLPAPVQGALVLASMVVITAMLSGGLPALADWTWWATAAIAGVCGAVMGWAVAPKVRR